MFINKHLEFCYEILDLFYNLFYFQTQYSFRFSFDFIQKNQGCFGNPSVDNFPEKTFRIYKTVYKIAYYNLPQLRGNIKFYT